MKAQVIFILVVLLCVAMADDYITDCSALRVGTVKDATDVMLDGKATEKWGKYKVTKGDDDVEVPANEGESVFYIHGVKLQNPIGVDINSEDVRLLYAGKTLNSDGSNNDKFELRIRYDCQNDLTGIANVLVKFTLDGNSCDNSYIGIRKKCGNSYSYAPISVYDTSGWFKNEITKDTEDIVVPTGTDELSFKVKNTASATDANRNHIPILPPMVRRINEAENAIYPVLRGAGARKHTLKPGEYEEFKLEFN